MTPRSEPPFRADHVGSLLRPPRLLVARAERAVEDDAIREVVKLQQNVGLRSATDGEFRRTSWHMDFIYQLSGVHRTDDQIQVHFRNAHGGFDFVSAALKIDGKIGLDGPIFGPDFEFLKSTVA